MPEARSAVATLVARARVVGRLVAEIRARELGWLLPILAALLLVGLLLAAVSGAELVAPFLYPLL